MDEGHRFPEKIEELNAIKKLKDVNETVFSISY